MDADPASRMQTSGDDDAGEGGEAGGGETGDGSSEPDGGVAAGGGGISGETGRGAADGNLEAAGSNGTRERTASSTSIETPPDPAVEASPAAAAGHPGGQAAHAAAVGREPQADSHQRAQRGLAGGGAPLPFLDVIQRAFGPHHNLSNIRAYKGGAAAQAAGRLGARAYTFGDQVAFQGEPDLHTAAHEAAHVVQQGAGLRLQAGVGEYGDAHEQQADAIADRVVRGESAVDLLPKRSERVVNPQVQKAPDPQGEISPGGAFLGPGWRELNEPGIVYQEMGATIRSAPDKGARAVTLLPQNAKVFLLRHEPQSRWYAVSTEDGLFGYIADWLIFRHLPEPGVDVYLVKKGDTPLDIARNRYGSDFDRWGQDLRFVVNALAYANSKSQHNSSGGTGLIKPGSINEPWFKTQARADVYIWLPSSNYLNSIFEEVRTKGGGTGSISYDAIASAAKHFGEFSVIPSYVGGLLHGFMSCIGDALSGLVDLLRSIFTGEIIEQLKQLWHALSNLRLEDIKNALESWWLSWRDRLLSDNPFVRGHAWGYLAGYLCGEIALFALGGAALNALKATKFASKLGQLIARVAPRLTQGVQRLVRTGGKVQETLAKAQQSVLKRFSRVGEVSHGLSSAAQKRLARYLAVDAMGGLSREALAALGNLSDEALHALSELPASKLQRVAGLLARDPAAGEDILKTYYYKFIKKTVPDRPLVDEFLKERLDNWAVAQKQGHPFGFGDKNAFKMFKQKIEGALKEFDIPTEDIRVHGGAITTRIPKDLDIAVMVDKATYERLVARLRQGIKQPKVLADFEKQHLGGHINSFYFERLPGKPSFSQTIYGAGGPTKIQVSIVLKGGPFDLGPYIRF